MCKTLCLVVEGYKSYVFENKVLRKIFSPKKFEGSEQSTIFHNEGLFHLY